ncbi:MAG: hypothetical protein M3020_00785 [Myxococcota bacterium]|nr:hypothetical protein [Myxococcota bacterium]
MFGGLRGPALLVWLQQRIASYYALDELPDVRDFVRSVEDDQREALLVRQCEDAIEIALLLPERVLIEAERAVDPDVVLQAVEGVSHFVFLAERVRIGLPTTRLELELQAEVDKFVLLALAGDPTGHAERLELRRSLFESVRFLHDESTEEGVRYRLANELAARYVRRFHPEAPHGEVRAELCRFYRAGQSDKIRMARAA